MRAKFAVTLVLLNIIMFNVVIGALDRVCDAYEHDRKSKPAKAVITVHDTGDQQADGCVNTAEYAEKADFSGAVSFNFSFIFKEIIRYYNVRAGPENREGVSVRAV